jgi:EAL domain-containing protein (putative c-di-GMP-specific phosphodiesterase class I)/PleD family two-component response regulator
MTQDQWLARATDPSSWGDSGGDARSPLLDATVMLVDDDPLMTDLVQGHLEDAGYRNFVVSNDPRQTLPLLQERQPAVLLLDLMMPQVSGFDVLAQLRADDAWRFLPVIVLTAATGAEAKLQALQLGATDFLSKPVDASELVLRVRNTLAFRQYHERSINYDEVTGLPTRRRLEKLLRDALAHLGGGDDAHSVALFNITVPACRQVAETLGQEAADQLARALALRLEAIARQHAGGSERVPPVARLRSEEFGLLLTGVRGLDPLERMARHITMHLGQPVDLGSQKVAPEAVLGIAVSGADGHSAGALMKGAELARTQAQKRPGLRYEFFSAELNRRSLEKLSQATQLRQAVERNEFQLHYQPKVDMRSGQVAGIEALLRWQHPTLGLLPPSRFLPLAEELGLMKDLGDWVLHKACYDGARWVGAGVPIGKLAVNVSASQFTGGRLAHSIGHALRSTQFPPELLVVEVTESMLMNDVQAALAMLHDIKSLGVSLSIDDFGTGYSSLSYIKMFPVSELKIDRSFVADLPGGVSDEAIVRAIVSLGHNLGMNVVAEGVETAEQLLALHGLEADMYQGFLFSRPVAEGALLPLLRSSAR